MPRSVWLLCASHRGNLADVEAQVAAQTMADACTLVFVANGPAASIRYTPSLAATRVLIVPEAGLVNALNIGLAMIQHFAHPEDWVCKFDDDDLYGRDYVERVMRLDPSAQAAGRTHVWVRSQSQRLWGLDFGDINTNAPHGPTLAARAGCFLPFKRQRCPWGEDSAWWSDMRAAGVRFHDVGRDGFCWVRSNDAHHKHSYPFADNEMRDTAINGVYDYGEFDVRVAMGEAPTPPGQLLPQQDLDFAAYEAAINKTINEVSYG